MACVGEVLIDWIRATDAHAGHRLPLLLRAQQIIEGEEPAAEEQRQTLASAIERWRYQCLRNVHAPLSGVGRRLVDTLDDLARRLVDDEPRAPRAPRDALAGAGIDASQIGHALESLDPKVPLERVTARAQTITQSRFSLPMRGGAPTELRRRMLLYAPLYLSSYCTNHCTYCGFRYPQPIERRHLDYAEALAEADLLAQRGFRHILLVAGDFPQLTSAAYCAPIVRALVERGLIPALEIAPQSTADYHTLIAAGAVGVTLYQETYDTRLYAQYHPRGSKTAFDWRLEGPERALEAGCARMGLGILVGLADPHQDLRALMRHGQYLRQRFPGRTLAFSLPRIHDAPSGFRIPFPVDDAQFVRMYAALRIAFPDAELVLSTREPAELRARLAGICVTQMSAGSSTAPGGYGNQNVCDSRDGQFPVTDQRSAAEVAAWLTAAGFVPLWTLS